MADLPQTLNDVLDGIIESRGGRDRFSPLQLIAARGLTRCLGQLNNGDVSKASALATLEGMLPPVQAPAGPPIDLGRLTDSQVFALERLYAIARGERPAVPAHRRKSSTHWDAIRIAALADAVAERGPHGELTAAERAEVKQLLGHVLVRAQTTVASLWREHLEAPTALPVWENDLAYGRQDSSKAAGRSLTPAEENIAPLTAYSTNAQASTDGRPSNVVRFGGSGISNPALFDGADPSGRSRGMP